MVQVATQVFPFLKFQIGRCAWCARDRHWIPRRARHRLGVRYDAPSLKRTEDVDRATEKQRKSYTWIYVVVVGALLSDGLFSSVAIALVITPRLDRAREIQPYPTSRLQSYLRNLSDDKSAAYFADGIQDQFLTKLASIADLKVISRTSTRSIRANRKT